MCRQVINTVAARDEALKRSNPDEYVRQLLICLRFIRQPDLSAPNDKKFQFRESIVKLAEKILNMIGESTKVKKNYAKANFDKLIELLKKVQLWKKN